MTAEERRAIVRKTNAAKIKEQEDTITQLSTQLEATRLELDRASARIVELSTNWSNAYQKSQQELANYKHDHARSILQQLEACAQDKYVMIFSNFAAKCMVDMLKELANED